MHRPVHASGVAALLVIAGAAAAQGPASQPPDPQRGRLLYETHCIECHDTAMHWRDAKAAKDYRSLRAQVDRWQNNASLKWTRDDIESVTRHLNDTIYKFAPEQVTGRVEEGRARLTPAAAPPLR